MHANKQNPIDYIEAGDIGAAVVDLKIFKLDEAVRKSNKRHTDNFLSLV
jgi:hypothetical protein